MNGAQHCAEAERLINSVAIDNEDGEWFGGNATTAANLAAAQVHATLALAAATATNTTYGDEQITGARVDPGWEQVLGYEELRVDGGVTR